MLPLKGKYAEASLEEMSDLVLEREVPSHSCRHWQYQGAERSWTRQCRNTDKKWLWQSSSQSLMKWQEKNHGSDFSLFKNIHGSEAVFFAKLKSWIILACPFTWASLWWVHRTILVPYLEKMFLHASRISVLELKYKNRFSLMVNKALQITAF